MRQALLTTSFTALAGIVIFVLGQIFVVLFLERIRKQARTIEEIAEALVVFAREYSNVVGPTFTETHHKRLEAQNEMRRLAARLRSSAQTLPFYGFFHSLRLVQSRNQILEASRNLIGLSNHIAPRNTDDLNSARDLLRQIEGLLGIRIEPR